MALFAERVIPPPGPSFLSKEKRPMFVSEKMVTRPVFVSENMVTAEEAKSLALPGFRLATLEEVLSNKDLVYRMLQEGLALWIVIKIPESKPDKISGVPVNLNVAVGTRQGEFVLGLVCRNVLINYGKGEIDAYENTVLARETKLHFAYIEKGSEDCKKEEFGLYSTATFPPPQLILSPGAELK